MPRVPFDPPSAPKPPGGPGQFANRSDLTGTQPVTVPSGLAYGDRKRQEQAQSVVPLPSGTGGTQAPPGGPAPTPSGAPAAAPPQPIPANILDILSHQTQRPNEPVTTPSSMGPTAGAQEPVAMLINRAAEQNPDSSDLQYLRSWINGGR